MTCWRCKHEMPDGLRYCGNCGVRLNRVAYVFEWLFSKKGLPILLLILALIIGGAVWGIIAATDTPELDLDLDMGWYSPGDGDIVYKDADQSYGYVSNMILIFFTKAATDEQIAEVVDSVDGEVVGILPGVNQYQVRVTTRTEEELEALRKELMAYDIVKNAVIDYVTTIEGETAAIPNDPWDGAAEADWDEDNPDGSNWWIEAAHILSAWEYCDSFSHIGVGVVDNGYDLTHEDLELVVLNEELNSVEAHGTHVAGIIGATHNNGLGISGVKGYLQYLSVDKDAEALLYDYMDLLEEEYHYQRVNAENSYYSYRFMGTDAPELFSNGSHVWLKITEQDAEHLRVEFAFRKDLVSIEVQP